MIDSDGAKQNGCEVPGDPTEPEPTAADAYRVAMGALVQAKCNQLNAHGANGNSIAINHIVTEAQFEAMVRLLIDLKVMTLEQFQAGCACAADRMAQQIAQQMSNAPRIQVATEIKH